MVLHNMFCKYYPLQKLSNQQLFETNQGKKKIKFKTITKRLPDHSLIDILNSAIDDTNNALVANKYFEPNEISSVIKKHTSNFIFSF